MKGRAAIVIVLALGAWDHSAAQDADQEISLKFAIDGKTKPCKNLKVEITLDGQAITPKLSAHGILVPDDFRKRLSEWPEGKTVDISIDCGEYSFQFPNLHPGWVTDGAWEVGIAYPPYWFREFSYTAAIEHGEWLSYLISECNGCDPGVVTSVSHQDVPNSLVADLIEEQGQASGERARDIAYELAAFGVDYRRNRDNLMARLHSCLSKPKESPEDDVCNGQLVDYVTNLCWRGDDELLGLLLKIADLRKDVILEIGTFYSGLLDRRTDDTLRAMQALPSGKQRLICSLAKDDLRVGTPQFDRVVTNLRAANNEAAHRCLQEFEKATGTIQ